MPTSRVGDRVRRTLPALAPRHHAMLERSLRRAIKVWDAEGWAFIGSPPRLRIAVLVRERLERPPHPVTTIALPRSLGGGRLKIAVIALNRESETRDLGQAVPPGGGISYLAPGVPISCDDARIGIGAVVAVDDQPHIVTCGHAISSDEATLTTVDGETEIAALRANFFAAGDRLDAAVFTVNPDGLALLRQGAAAPTWCDGFHEPTASDNNRDATFWPTWANAQDSFDRAVVAFSACVPAGVGCGYVMLARCTNPGDSGSTLQIDNQYLALASQRDGEHSFFTPLSAVVNKLRASGASVAPWRPT
jgi:hypothetical protein